MLDCLHLDGTYGFYGFHNSQLEWSLSIYRPTPISPRSCKPSPTQICDYVIIGRLKAFTLRLGKCLGHPGHNHKPARVYLVERIRSD